MKRFVFIFGLILLLIITNVLADTSENIVSATGYVTLEIKEPPKIDFKALPQSELTGFSIKSTNNKYNLINENSLLLIFIASLLFILTIFNIYQCNKYLQEQKSII